MKSRASSPAFALALASILGGCDGSDPATWESGGGDLRGPRLDAAAAGGAPDGGIDAAAFEPGSGLDYRGPSHQFAGGFTPTRAPHGGFGGGDCEPSRVPVVFVHGNGDHSVNWDYPASTGGRSAYDALRAAGYEPCELFGISYLSESERDRPERNYHRPSKADLVSDFVRDVLAYTGRDEVDIVGHSMGVTIAMHALERASLWPSVRRFVSISGGLRGLTVCDSSGYANPAFPICGSQNIYDDDVFGFYRHAWYAPNPRMGAGGYRDEPERWGEVLFYSLRAGVHDQILCATAGFVSGCDRTAVFDEHENVRSQLEVGYGSTAAQLDFDLGDWSIFNTGGGDIDGVGHFRARNNTGAILGNMLLTACTGEDCCDGYPDVCSR